MEVDEYIEAGHDVLVAAFVAHGRGAESGMHVNQRMFHVWDMRNGKVLRCREYLERDDALTAAGLSEQPPKNA